MSNRAPSTVWGLRDLSKYPNGYVRTTEADDGIELVYFTAPGAYAQVITMTRADARLLAKRINECLDSTVKR